MCPYLYIINKNENAVYWDTFSFSCQFYRYVFYSFVIGREFGYDKICQMSNIADVQTSFKKYYMEMDIFMLHL